MMWDQVHPESSHLKKEKRKKRVHLESTATRLRFKTNNGPTLEIKSSLLKGLVGKFTHRNLALKF